MLNRVFVYGTLKPGLRYHDIAEQGGKFSAQEAYIEGFDLYDLSPENYPAIIEGTHRVHGWCFTYEDIDAAMPFLDELEGIDCDPPLYKRMQTPLYIRNVDASTSSITGDTTAMTWVYVYFDQERCRAGDSVTYLPEGVWLPREDENSCISSINIAHHKVLAVRNSPIMTMNQTIEALRTFLHSSGGNSRDEIDEFQIVTQFFPTRLPNGEHENEIGVMLPPPLDMQKLEAVLERQPNPTFALSSLEEGSYVRCIHHGAYHSLNQAWIDFGTSVSSGYNDFQIEKGAPCFQLFDNYDGSPLATDLRTDLYLKLHNPV